MFTDCCTDLLIEEKSESNWKHWEKTDFYNSTFTMSGLIWNGYPEWENLVDELSLWHENGFWLMGDMDKAHFESDTFPDCPELVENWSSLAIGAIIYSLEKLTCQNTSKE